MKRRFVVGITVAVGLLVMIGAAMAFMLMRKEPEWTSSSPRAVSEFNAGLEAERKFYFNEALEHYRRALQIDPEFVMAKTLLAGREADSPEERDEFKQLLESVDLRKLNERERFLIRSRLAQVNRQPEQVNQLLEAYLRNHPNDPVGVNRLCTREWEARNWDKAESCFKRLIELDPNWVTAQNHLGYIAMAQGQFQEAEELFRMYRYIAPNQANPHDSLGELLTLVGRYDEAEKALNEALKVRSDFCASYSHLVLLAMVKGDDDLGRRALARAHESDCPEQVTKVGSCALETFRHFSRGKWSQTVEAAKAKDCYKDAPPVLITGYAAALASNRVEDAKLFESLYQERQRHAFEPYHRGADDAVGVHMEGVKLAFQGQPQAAAEKLREADRLLVFWGDGQGIFKLYNQALLAEVLKKAGQTEQSQQALAEAKAVNPQFIEHIEMPLFRAETTN